MITKVLTPLTEFPKVIAKAPSALKKAALIVLTVAVVGAASLPAAAHADVGTSAQSDGIQISDKGEVGNPRPSAGHIPIYRGYVGPFFVYAAFDTPGHKIARCKRMNNKPHYNINVKWHHSHPDAKAIMKLHVTKPDKTGAVFIYESKTGICATIQKEDLRKEMRGIVDAALANSAALAAVGSAALGVLVAVLWIIVKFPVCKGAC